MRARIDVACAFEESNEQVDSFLRERRRDDMQLEHGLEQDDDSKIGRAVRGTCSYRSRCLLPRRLRSPSVLIATCYSCVLVDRFVHLSTSVTFDVREVVLNARNEID